MIMETSSDCEFESSIQIQFSKAAEDTTDIDSPKTPKFSPPYKRIRALRLFNNDAHHNPKALRSCSTSLYSKFLQVSPLHSQQTATASTTNYQLACNNNNNLNGSFNRSRDNCAVPVPSVNINPFSPEGAQLSTAQKRSYQQLQQHSGSPELGHQQLNVSRISDDGYDIELDNTSMCNTSIGGGGKRELRESNISRYHEEFHDVELIGTGQFASVYKCINRLDGCVYAVKKSTKAVVGGVAANLALKEVYAHAVLGRHPHVVRYYSAWLENDHMIIQNEYCNGGSLQDKIMDSHLEVWDLRKLLRQVAEGLRFIHASGLVHLDIKTSNIFVSRERRCTMYVDPYDSADDTEHEGSGGGREGGDVQQLDEAGEMQDVYKIGDLGHVASTRAATNNTAGICNGGNNNIEEGDCRYLAVEILHEDYTLLPASDIFSLGITALEAAGVQPLPKAGLEWHKLRSGEREASQLLQHRRATDQLPTPLAQLIFQMMEPTKERRPTASCVVQHNAVQPQGCKSRAQLYRELNAEKMKNDFLQKQVLEVTRRQTVQVQQCAVGGKGNGGRLVGGKHVAVSRSNSTTNF